MPNDWESSWAQFFAKHRLKAILEDDRRNNGADRKMDELGRQCVEEVVPRLLGAVEENGNSINPVLLHGDLFVPYFQIDEDGVEMPGQMKILANL
jgi:protein-ribulosamine 3-kinase